MDTRVGPDEDITNKVAVQLGTYSSESTVLTIMREGQVRDVNLELTIPTE